MLKALLNRLIRKDSEYPRKCPFCGERKYIAKGWARFPNHKLTKRDKAAKPLFLDLTDQAEQEWFDYIVCLHCYRIIWYQLDSHGESDRDISLPTLQELTGWQELPHSPVILYDKVGNPVYGTKRSQEMYQEGKPC